MRSLVNLIGGGPGRAAVSAAAIVTIGFLIDGRADTLLRALFVTAVWGSATFLAFLTLLFLAAALDPDVDAVVVKAAPESEDADHG
ncbi:hypothetical protein MKK55_18030 [Methylobacterium sp. J-059]|uniref:hypothetical protein n=1 Tax=Methylobacterium sp. J-059 TaxID=2836643 RepID=UPI001FBA7076|nr:hypothetical protein [Methylobacterium sp. J-059]MCJ2040832.1 hypothetical protein [Methylobacterium sp. J-059]